MSETSGNRETLDETQHAAGDNPIIDDDDEDDALGAALFADEDEDAEVEAAPDATVDGKSKSLLKQPVFVPPRLCLVSTPVTVQTRQPTQKQNKKPLSQRNKALNRKLLQSRIRTITSVTRIMSAPGTIS